ncbi:MAG: hypothetical protein ACT4P4_22055, partial [Betaproteobacteria bacterium]
PAPADVLDQVREQLAIVNDEILPRYRAIGDTVGFQALAAHAERLARELAAGDREAVRYRWWHRTHEDNVRELYAGAAHAERLARELAARMYRPAPYPPADRPNDPVRLTAHALQRGDDAAIERAAAQMAKGLPWDVVLVPVPGHGGRAEQTLRLASAIADVVWKRNGGERFPKGAPKHRPDVRDILRGGRRERQYDLKKAGELPLSGAAFGFRHVGYLPNTRIFLVDGVMGTGETMKAALAALETPALPLVYAREPGAVWIEPDDAQASEGGKKKTPAPADDAQASEGGGPAAEPLAGVEDDIPRDLAVRAFSGTSFVPERRADSYIRDYAEQLRADHRFLEEKADTPEKRAELARFFADYRAGYRSRFTAWLSARTRVMSAMIVGPARFPVDQNRKRGDSADRRLGELLEFRKKALGRMMNVIAPAEARSISSDDPQAVAKLKEKLTGLEGLQARMKAVNDAHRRFLKDPASLERSELGEADKQRIRNYTPKYSWEPHPFAPYQLQNNSAEVRRVKARIEELDRRAGDETFRQQFDGFEVVDSVEGNRLQVFFPGKPDEATRSKLKANGFKWAPSEGAWQRFRGPNAEVGLERALGVRLERSPPAPAAAAEDQVPESLVSEPQEEAPEVPGVSVPPASAEPAKGDRQGRLFESRGRADLAKRVEDLERRVDRAYERGDPNAEDLDAELAELRKQLVSAVEQDQAELDADDQAFDYSTIEEELRSAYVNWLRGGGTYGTRENAREAMLDVVTNAGGKATAEQAFDAAADAYAAAVARRVRRMQVHGGVVLEETEDGPVLRSREVAIVQPSRWDSALQFAGSTVYQHTALDVASRQPVGVISLRWQGGRPIELLHVELARSQRGKGKGDAVVRAVLEAAGPGREVQILNIAAAAEGFWRKMGVAFYEDDTGKHGSATLEAYLDARDGGRGPSAREGASPAGEPPHTRLGETRRREALPDLTPAVRKKLVEAFGPGVDALIDSGFLNFAATPAQLPPNLKRKTGGTTEAWYDPSARGGRGAVWLIVSQLDLDRVVPVFLHEVGEHHSLERILGPEAYALLQDTVRDLTEHNPVVERAWKTVVQRYPRLVPGSKKFVSEVIALVGESDEGMRLPFMRRLINAVREFLVRLGLQRGKVDGLTDRDIVLLVQAAARRTVEEAAAGVDREEASAPREYSPQAALREFFVPPHISKILEANDALGYGVGGPAADIRRAAQEILKHDDWAERWEIVPADFEFETAAAAMRFLDELGMNVGDVEYRHRGPAEHMVTIGEEQSRRLLDEWRAGVKQMDRWTEPQASSGAKSGRRKLIEEAKSDPSIAISLAEPSEPQASEGGPPSDFTRTEHAYGGRAAWQTAKDAGRTVLNYRQWVQVRTPAFKRWFGDWELAALDQAMRRVRGSDAAKAVRGEIVG